jgi:hypothetical protein
MPTLTLPKPHPAQQQVIDAAKRFNVLCCGRKFGKTELGMDRLIHPALQGKPVAWFSPTYRTLADVFRELQRRLRPIVRDASQVERRIELRGGGVIEAWSLDNSDAGRGRGYAVVCVDEAAIVPNLESAWVENVRAQLTEHRGSAWFLSTPKGTANYFYTLYQKGQDPAQVDWASWQMPTASNPYIAPEEIEAARADVTDLAFAQEYLAHFVSWAGAVFRRITDCVAAAPANTPAAIIGADWGRTNDYTVFAALSGRGEVLEIDRFRGLEYSLQRGRLAAFHQRLGGRAYIVAESNNMGGPIVEALQQSGLPVVAFTTTNASKAAAVEALALAFERGDIKIPNDPVLIGELQAFEGKTLPSGLMRYAAPEGGHDDTVMSLAIGWAGLGALQAHQSQRVMFIDPYTGRLSQDPVPYRISAI